MGAIFQSLGRTIIAGIVILACALIVAIDSYTYYRDGAANRGRETPAGLRDAR